MLAKVEIRGLYQCWIWQGWTAGGNRSWDRFGPYPRMKVDGKARYVHQLVLELAGHPQPSPDHVAHHWCRTRLCINPLHLEWITGARNSKLATEARGTEPEGWEEPVW